MIPVIKVLDRNISIAGFEFDGQNGTKTISFSIQRSYKSKQTGQWVNETIKCYEDDLLKIANLCLQAYNEACERRSGQPTSVPEAPPAQQQPAQQTPDDGIPF